MPTFRTSQAVSAADVRVPHIVLVGLPGSGKTTVGRAVAEKLNRNFLDFDAEIERREMASISEIIGAKGEAHFRQLERRLTEELREVGNYVLAPGGGWMMNPGCPELLRPPALIVYLKTRPETALLRMGTESVKRPLLARPNPLAELRRLLREREPFYLQSDHTVSTEMMTLEQVLSRIVVLARG
jgi:shikimate kinase